MGNRFSIVTPSFNQGAFIRDTICSVHQQRDEVEVQYIVMDNCSTDATPQVLASCQEQIDHCIVQPDDGQADALSRGFSLADGDIYAYLNSDDTLLPGTLAWVQDYFHGHPDVDAIYAHRLFTTGSNTPTRFWLLPPHNNYCMMRWDFIPQETCFWRAELYDRVGGIDPTYQFAMDYDLFVRFMQNTRMVRVNQFLATFREHESSKTSTLNETVGRAEVERVRQSYSIKANAVDRVIEPALGLFVHAASHRLKNWLISDNRYLRYTPRGII